MKTSKIINTFSEKYALPLTTLCVCIAVIGATIALGIHEAKKPPIQSIKSTDKGCYDVTTKIYFPEFKDSLIEITELSGVDLKLKDTVWYALVLCPHWKTRTFDVEYLKMPGDTIKWNVIKIYPGIVEQISNHMQQKPV